MTRVDLRMDQGRIVRQQLTKQRTIAVNDGVDGALEPRHRRVSVDGLDKRLERGPVAEVVPACHRHPRVVSIDDRGADIGVRHVALQPGNRGVEKFGMFLSKYPDRGFIAGKPTGQQFISLRLVRGERRVERKRFHDHQLTPR